MPRMLFEKIGRFPWENVTSKNLAFFVEAYLIVGSLTKIHPHIHTLTDADNHWFNHLFHLDIKTVQLIQLIQPQQFHGFHFYIICDTVIPVGRPGQFLCLTLPGNLGHIDQWSKAHHGSRQHPGDVSFLFHFPLISQNNLMISHDVMHFLWFSLPLFLWIWQLQPWGFEDPTDLRLKA